MRVCVIFNPAARGQKAQKLAGLLQTFARNCHCKPTAAAGDARSLAAEAVREGFDTVVAAGGDGTLNEVLNGIGEIPGGFGKVRLGVLPLGTINVFAREIGIQLKPEQAWEIILQGREISIDLPKAEFQFGGKTVSRYFAQLAGAGLDSNAVALKLGIEKENRAVCLRGGGNESVAAPPSKITASSSAGSTTGELVLIGNGRLYGGSFVLFSKADLRDGLLDACVFPKVNWLTLFRAGLGLMTKRLHRVCDVRELQAAEVMLTADRPTFLQLDGENVGELPAKFSTQPKLLRVIVP